MAAPSGGDDIQDSSNCQSSSNSANILQRNVDKIEDVSTNGTVSCSSHSETRRSTNLLKPSVISSQSPASTFGSNVSSSFGSQTKTPFSLKPSAFGSATNPDSSNFAAKRPVQLRASQLESVANSPVSSTTNSTNSSFFLSPAKLNNPFFKAVSDDKSDDGCSSTVTSVEEESCNLRSSDLEKSNSSNCVAESAKVSFVPLASTNSAGSSQSLAPSAVSTSIPSFVFGQNLHERVEGPAETVRSEAESSGEVAVSDARTSDCDVSKTNGATPAMLFSSVIQQELPDKQAESLSDERKRKSLSEAAREYEESRAIKRKYEEVKVKTGEEEEINVLQINCKLFAFNKEKSTWVERGRGTLRLNDLSLENRTQSRVVMRVSGSLRVVLNTKIWAEMAVDQPSEKSVRLTAMDASGEIKVFLVMAGIKEIDQLFKALEWRVNNQKKMASSCEKSLETNGS